MPKRCECSDSGCKVPHGNLECGEPNDVLTLFRIDMEDRTGTDFCEACAEDAYETGLFSDEPNFYSR